MKSIYSYFIFCFLFFSKTFSQTTVTATWVYGDSSTRGESRNYYDAVYGTRGVASPSNYPGPRLNGATWTDKNGNLWLFGGEGRLNDLWQFDPFNKLWTWMSGDSTRSNYGVYGTKGIPSSTNKPGARDGVVSWRDATGNFWLFGGFGYGSSSFNQLNDLWKYNPSTNQWTWINGDSTTKQHGIYGTKGISTPNTKPGGRHGAVSWIDLSGNLWLFGGNGVDANCSCTFNELPLNDLWRYQPSSNQWTWVNGDSIGGKLGVYGTKGVAAATNKPQGRNSAVSWTDQSDNLWMMGGLYGQGQEFNDLWKYSPASNQWTWMSGDNTFAAHGIYGAIGVATATNKPGARYGAVSWKDATGSFWMMGGSGYAASGAIVMLNDLWKFDGTWTWMSGDSIGDQHGIYGGVGVASATNKPGTRRSAVSWTDATGSFWMMGGLGFNQSQHYVDLNDLWKFTISNPTIANLSNLSLSAGMLTPVFTSNTTTYSASVANSVTSIIVTPTLADPLATVTVNNIPVISGSPSTSISLKEGANTITIVVTAANGTTTKTYTVAVTRNASSSNNANLSNLSLSTGTLTPVFDPGTFNYTAKVANSVTCITVNATVADSTATVKVKGITLASGQASECNALNVGSNTILIVVTAQDGITTKTYTIVVTRDASISNNANLSNLVIGSGVLIPVFDPGTINYTATVANSVTSITLTPTLADAYATVTVNGMRVISGNPSTSIFLNVGTNTITTTVTAQDGITIKSYTVVVIRNASGFNNANLSNLALSAGTFAPAFAQNTTSYTAFVANSVTAITVTPTASDANATIKVNGTTVASGHASASIAIYTGSNTISIIVTSPDGTTAKTYMVLVTREALSGSVNNLVQWKKADGGNDHWYRIVVKDSKDKWHQGLTTGINFTDAKGAATALGGYLATPNQTGEANFIYNNLVAPVAGSKAEAYWLGAYSQGISDNWHWATGGTVTSWGGTTYFDWWDTKNGTALQGIIQVPNNFWNQAGATLQDLPADNTANGFVVEYDTHPSDLVQWKKADGGNDHWYRIVVKDSKDKWNQGLTTGINFNDAKGAATALGGYMATPNQAGEADFIYNNLVAPIAGSKMQAYWLGVYSPGIAYGWEWVTGCAVTAWNCSTYLDWWDTRNGTAPQGIIQVPNNSWNQGGATLQDLPADNTANGFVIEYDLLPPDLVQWRKADGGNDHWYRIVVKDSKDKWNQGLTTGINFNDAKGAAAALAGYLATPDRSGEGDFIYNNLVAPVAGSKTQAYWLGVYSQGIAYNWEWVTGGLVTAWGGSTYLDWWDTKNGTAPQGIIQVPNNSWNQAGATLQDLPADNTANGFVIEYDVLPATGSPANGITVAGGNGAGGAANQLNQPHGVAVDASGNIYVTDNVNHRVQKWAPGATSGVTVAGGNGAGGAANQLNYPHGIFVDMSGNIFIADISNHRIQKWAPGATSGVTVAGGNGAGAAANQLNSPTDVFVDATGNVYVADDYNHRIQKWSPTATSGITVAGGNGAGGAANQLNYPQGVFVDKSGNIFIADYSNHRIQKWAPGATSGTTVAGGNCQGDAANQLHLPDHVFVDGNCNMFIADDYNHRIQMWVPGAASGVTVAGGNGPGGAADQLNVPTGSFVDASGTIYVADRDNHRVQKFGSITAKSSTSEKQESAAIVVAKAGLQNQPVPDIKLSAEVYPNPSSGQFAVTITSSNNKESITLQVFDAIGRAAEPGRVVAPNQTLQLGYQYKPGLYIIVAQQGSSKVVQKVIKLGE